MTLPPARLIFVLLFVVSVSMMLVGAYFEHVMELEPCPLCITQRAFIVLVGVTGLIGAIHGPRHTGRKIYGGLVALAATGGGFFSGRQLWLQSLPPDQAPACGPSIEYILDTFPISEALAILLRGDGNCAEVLWTFLGLSIPGWTLVGFAGLAVLGLYSASRFAAPT